MFDIKRKIFELYVTGKLRKIPYKNGSKYSINNEIDGLENITKDINDQDIQQSFKAKINIYISVYPDQIKTTSNISYSSERKNDCHQSVNKTWHFINDGKINKKKKQIKRKIPFNISGDFYIIIPNVKKEAFEEMIKNNFKIQNKNFIADYLQILIYYKCSLYI